MTDKLPDVMTDAEWKAFIGQFNTKAPTGLRNVALFTLMHDAGLRTCEAIGLKTCDIRQDTLDGQPVTLLTLKGKGGKERVVYLNEDADRLLQAWREKRSELGIGRSKHVFTTLKGGALKDSYLREVCARKGAEAGIEWRVHPHALRHTFATDLLEETGDLALVQDALGHSDPETTRIYAKVRNGRLARAMTGRKQAAPEPEEAEDADEIEALKQQVAALTEKLDELTKQKKHRGER